MSQERELTARKLFFTYYDQKLAEDTSVTLEGWVKSHRNNGSVGFIEFNDGSYFKSIQLVYDKDNKDFESISKVKYGSAIQITGKVKLTPTMKQPFEIHVDSVKVLGDCAEDYPLQKKKHSFEFLREIAYLRPRANTFNAVYRVRNTLAYAIHKFFQERGFMYVQTPIITANDAEGAGQVFHVVSDFKNPNEFFNSSACLTVSGQLHVESFALAFRDVYTFGPTFRAEKSNTNRHASEFWMIEPEIAFADLEDDMNLIESFIKYIIKYVLDNCKDEMEFFNNFIDKGVLDKLHTVINAPFVRMEYTKAIKTVAACDLLVPKEGEIVGGSQREEDFAKLEAKMKEMGNEEGLKWYLNLRKYGGCIHSGFGLGFDRLLMYITGMQNIRDVQPFPRYPGSLKY